MTKILLTRNEVAARAGVCGGTVDRDVRLGKFRRVFRIGGTRLRFHTDDVDAWLESRSGTALAPREA